MVLHLVSPQRPEDVSCLVSTDVAASCLVLPCFSLSSPIISFYLFMFMHLADAFIQSDLQMKI